MTTNNVTNDENFESADNSEFFSYYRDISKLFKKIKSKGILNETIIIDTYQLADERLLETGNFIDKVIYYRINKHYAIKDFAKKLGLDTDSYYQYESGKMKLQNVETLKKIIEVLEMKEDDLPEYIKFQINNPTEILNAFMKKHNMSKKEFSKNTKVPKDTVYKWFTTDIQISINSFNKIRDYMGEEIWNK